MEGYAASAQLGKGVSEAKVPLPLDIYIHVMYVYIHIYICVYVCVGGCTFLSKPNCRCMLTGIGSICFPRRTQSCDERQESRGPNPPVSKHRALVCRVKTRLNTNSPSTLTFERITRAIRPPYSLHKNKEKAFLAGSWEGGKAWPNGGRAKSPLSPSSGG